jgi:misacylated tRNA(Ala) deacylase
MISKKGVSIMTEILYMNTIEDCYLRQFEAEVKRVNDDDNWIELDRTAFYPLGGGQPTDKGVLEWDGGSTDVKQVLKKNIIKHYLDGEIPEVGTMVRGTIDWDRRYSHMKMHTSQHLLSAVIWDKFKASTVGNQIHSDRSHIDFHPASFTMEELKGVESEVNKLMEEGHDVYLEEVPREVIEANVESERVDLSRLPPSIKKLRTIFIGNNGKIDICPCAGTHVKSLSEIGEMKIIRRKSKGSGKIRVEYELF